MFNFNLTHFLTCILHATYVTRKETLNDVIYGNPVQYLNLRQF